MSDIIETSEFLEQIAFQLIAHAGEARSNVFEALTKVIEGKNKEAKELIKKADDELVLAHKAQFDLITREARGNPVEPTILLVHAQDILMASLTEKALAEKIIDIYESLKSMIQKNV
ncbi:MAG: PTS lactose/cellobiose transporter subunit IIA [Pelolinea sp.]|nr:PTS lactose/cellobiose transporter subunit IIA [Pelolinea sp.]